MARTMRHGGKTYSKGQWKELMNVAFGHDTSDPNDEGANFEMDDDAVPTYFCESCDAQFPGESQDLEDAPLNCPYCKKQPGAQAMTVTFGHEGRKSKRTFPFYIPRPPHEPPAGVIG